MSFTKCYAATFTISPATYFVVSQTSRPQTAIHSRHNSDATQTIAAIGRDCDIPNNILRIAEQLFQRRIDCVGLV